MDFFGKKYSYVAVFLFAVEGFLITVVMVSDLHRIIERFS